MLSTTLLFAALAATGLASPVAKRAEANQATYYTVGLGECGWTNSDSDAVVALNTPQWDGGSHCGEGVTITNPSSGKVVHATVVDRCPECLTGSLDLSPSLFEELYGSLDAGRLSVSFTFDGSNGTSYTGTVDSGSYTDTATYTGTADSAAYTETASYTDTAQGWDTPTRK